ncbi:hypothetical protein MMC07_002798, partial [Pseudocyphellaria aurata]|nr:hypothetical protein [Pseudocyphellaria aurata]
MLSLALGAIVPLFWTVAVSLPQIPYDTTVPFNLYDFGGGSNVPSTGTPLQNPYVVGELPSANLPTVQDPYVVASANLLGQQTSQNADQVLPGQILTTPYTQTDDGSILEGLLPHDTTDGYLIDLLAAKPPKPANQAPGNAPGRTTPQQKPQPQPGSRPPQPPQPPQPQQPQPQPQQQVRPGDNLPWKPIGEEFLPQALQTAPADGSLGTTGYSCAMHDPNGKILGGDV